MGTRTPRFEIPRWILGVIIAFGIVASGYVYVYGGDPLIPVLTVFAVIGTGLSLFVVYLLYRFVVAFETLADKY